MHVPTEPPTPTSPWTASHIVPLASDVTRGPIQNMTEYRRLEKQPATAITGTTIPVKTKNRFEHLENEIIDANTTTKTKPAKNQTNAVPTSPMDERPYAPDLSTIEENEEDSVDKSEAHKDEEIISNSVVDESGDSPREVNSASDSEIEDEDIKFNPGPLGNTFLDVGEVITILSGPHAVLEHVPVERKDGNYYIVDNTENIERRKQGKRSEFEDNCGAWTNGTSPTYTFIIRDNNAVTVHLRNELYCVEKMRNKSKVYEPNSDDIFVLNQLYNYLSISEKGPNQFRRRCTWVVNAPSSLPRLD